MTLTREQIEEIRGVLACYDEIEAQYEAACDEENETGHPVDDRDAWAHDDGLARVAHDATRILRTLVEEAPEDGEVGTCRRCKRQIIWERDNDRDPYGFWLDNEHGTEVCTPGPNDEDFYHEPEEDQ